MPDIPRPSRSSHWNRTANRILVVASTVALIAAADRLRSAWELPGQRYLLIHADDAGLCAAANRATIAALDEGAVTSASIMVPCPGFEEFAAYARSRPDLDFGVHLTLTSEWDDVRWGPITDPARVPSLVQADGTFRQSADEFALYAKVDEVEVEVRAQIECARERGIVLSHLDNHMNSLFRRPDLIDLLVRVSLEVDLPVRYVKTLPPGWDQILSTEVVDAYYRQLKALDTRRFPLADFIEADNYQVPPGQRRAYLLEVVRKLRPGVTELVVHCCDRDGGDWYPPDADGRHAETGTLRFVEFVRELDTLGITPIDWQDFRTMQRGESRKSW